MSTAIRRTKSLSAWLTMIVAIFVVSVSSVLMMSGLSQPHVDSDTAAVTGVSTRGGLHSDATAGTSASSLVVGRSAASTFATPTPTVAVASSPALASSASEASTPSALSAASSAPASAANDTVSNSPNAASDAASATHADRTVAPVDAAARRAAARNAARVAARRQAAIEAARVNRSLRADIALYNAERMAGLNRPQKVAPVQAAAVPRGHSLWDEVPAPLSNLYRN